MKFRGLKISDKKKSKIFEIAFKLLNKKKIIEIIVRICSLDTHDGSLKVNSRPLKQQFDKKQSFT